MMTTTCWIFWIAREPWDPSPREASVATDPPIPGLDPLAPEVPPIPPTGCSAWAPQRARRRSVTAEKKTCETEGRFMLRPVRLNEHRKRHVAIPDPQKVLRVPERGARVEKRCADTTVAACRSFPQGSVV